MFKSDWNVLVNKDYCRHREEEFDEIQCSHPKNKTNICENQYCPIREENKND